MFVSPAALWIEKVRHVGETCLRQLHELHLSLKVDPSQTNAITSKKAHGQTKVLLLKTEGLWAFIKRNYVHGSLEPSDGAWHVQCCTFRHSPVAMNDRRSPNITVLINCCE